MVQVEWDCWWDRLLRDDKQQEKQNSTVYPTWESIFDVDKPQM